LADWSTIAPILLGVAGFAGAQFLEKFFGFLSEGARREEADRTAIAERIEAMIFEVRELAIAYWIEDGSSDGLDQSSASIIGRLTFISELQEELFRSDPSARRRVRGHFSTLNEACTGGEFQVSTRAAEPRRASDIELAAFALAHAVSAGRRRLPRRWFHSSP
jgi:hypothetical protein